MDNLARVIAVAVTNKQLAPCVKVLSAAYRASLQQSASFVVQMAFTYTYRGEQVGPIYSNQPVARLTFVQSLDAYYTRARGTVVDLPSMPDNGTPVVCVVTLQYPDGGGTNLDAGPADTTTFYPTFER